MRKLFTLVFMLGVYCLYYVLVSEVLIKNYDLRGVINEGIDELIKGIRPGSVTIAFLGDSSVQSGFIPRSISEGAYNFSNYGSDPRLSLMRYRQIVEKNEKPLRCLVVGSLFAYEMRYVTDEYFYTSHMYHDLYSFAQAIEIYNSSEKLKVFPARDHSRFEYYTKVIAAKIKIFGPTFLQLQNSLWPWNNSKNLNYYITDVVQTRGFVFLRPGHMRPSEKFYMNAKYFAKEFKPEATFNVYLDQLISEAISDNTKVIFTILPMYFESGGLEGKYLDDLESFIRSKQKKFPQMKIMRLKPELKKVHFYNMNHLSLKGAEIVTEDFKRQLGSECDPK